MTEAQLALMNKYQDIIPSTYHHIVNHLVLTEQYAAASMLVATLEQQAICQKETVRVRKVEQYALEEDLKYLKDEYKRLHRECDGLRMQSSGFQIRMEQLLTENAKLKALI